MKHRSNPSVILPGWCEHRSRPQQLIVVKGDQAHVVESLLRLGRLTISEIRDHIREARQLPKITTRRVEIAVGHLVQQKQVTTMRTDVGMVVVPQF